jgi:hypothetical protein
MASVTKGSYPEKQQSTEIAKFCQNLEKCKGTSGYKRSSHKTGDKDVQIVCSDLNYPR